MSSVRTGRYWTRIKRIIGGFLAAVFVLSFLAGVFAENQSVVNVITSVLGMATIVGFVVLVHSVYRDKTELSAEFPSVSERHWITIVVLGYFTGGYYFLLYCVVRYYKISRGPGDNDGTSESSPGMNDASTEPTVTVERDPVDASDSSDKSTTTPISAAERRERRQSDEVGAPDDSAKTHTGSDPGRESPSTEPASTADVSGTELIAALYPEPTEPGDQWFAVVSQTIAEHDQDIRDRSLLGTETVERVFTCSPTETVVATDDHIQVGGEVIEYPSVLDCRLKIGRSLLTDSQQRFQLHDCDYIGLTVAKEEVPVDGSLAEYDGDVFHLYLIGAIAEIEYQADRSDTAEETYTITDTPSVSESELKELYHTIRANQSESVPETYVLQEYIEVPANLVVEGWNESGVTTVSRDTRLRPSGSPGTRTLGPYKTPTPNSDSTVAAAVRADTDASSFVSEIDFLQVSDRGVFVDADPVLQFDYGASDRIRGDEKGFTLEAGEVTYRIRGPELFAGSGDFLRLDWGADPTRRDRQTRTLEEAISFVERRVLESTESGDIPTDQSVSESLEQLRELNEQGVLTDEEFEAKRAELHDTS